MKIFTDLINSVTVTNNYITLQRKKQEQSGSTTFFFSGSTGRGRSASTALVITVANLTTKSVVTVTHSSTQRDMRSTAGYIRYRLYTTDIEYKHSRR